ncbi:FxSxx-COOH system tetratricopeptide repeat protein [Actinomadura sp. WMMB 499]|uniref:FxSxx-COOH system tetratricopeptide repeat protein n=1 Tax=Actinomadura sp. WMMB 499 TaxID=1219491 RepID=UPI00124670CB|nr:FxSxx-COOH system tetratricopeptide repeat protein [Actinomadura sp. WMMB 499]QFG24987.1 tetratricopeptide repeat protein [Actinomadura sp. WMMB 499]
MNRRLNEVIEALAGLAPSPTARELADALWLARLLPPQTAADEATRETAGEDRDPASPSRPELEDSERTEPPMAMESAHPAIVSQQAALHLARPGVPAEGIVRAPAIPAISQALALGRALRPLRESTSSRTVEHLAEERTAQWIAETGIWQAVMEPAPERQYELALVADQSASMVVWGRIISEFHTLLERLGAFRDVRMWYLNTDNDVLVLKTATGSAVRDPNELIDPTRRRILLVYSDCIGRAWQDGRAAGVLERWAAVGPVAIVQPLPQRLWWRCGTTVEPVRLESAQPGLPNSRLTVRSRDGFLLPPGTPVPVMEMGPRWLRPWAEMVGGGARGINAMAMFTGTHQPKDAADGDMDRLAAHERVKRFSAISSPMAFQLARHLAAAPLRLKVMSLVQHATLPHSTRAHLAEVFLGGLLRRADQDGTPSGPDDVLYEFHDGVRDVLLSGLTRTEALRVLGRVWEVVRERLGSPLDFPALLRALEETSAPVQDDLPFAQVAAHVLRRIGGRYRDIADRLTAGAPARALSPGAAVTESGAERAAFPYDRSPQGAPDTPGPLVGGGLPTRNPDFTGRDELLRDLRHRLPDLVTALLPAPPHELGGQGKSQLAVEYAHRHANDYDLVWWIPAEQTPMARSSLAELARTLGTPLSDDINRTVEHVLDALRDGRPIRRWLLIYDNAADPDELVPLMPVVPGEGPLSTASPTGHVLVTSRDRRWKEILSTAEVGFFERRESIALLVRRAPELEPQEADRLADRVGDLPLAVEQVAAWHAATGRPSNEYLRLLDDRLRNVRRVELPPEYPPELAAALEISFEGLQGEASSAGRLLELLAFFGPEPVEVGLLASGTVTRLPPEVRSGLDDLASLREAMRAIARYSLGRFDTDQDGARAQVHRLVRTLLQQRLSEAERTTMQNLVHRILAEATPDAAPDDESTWPIRRWIAPHVQPTGLIAGATAEIREVALDQMRYLYLLGDFESSRRLGELAREHWRATWGEDDMTVLLAGRELANVLRALGELADAARLNAEIQQRTADRFGPNNIATLLATNSQAADMRLRGDFSGALELDQDTLQRMVRMFGREKRETFRVINNVGIDLRLLGEFERARELDADALDRLRTHFGASDRSMLLAMNQLARDLHGLGRYREAEPFQQEALDGMRQTLAPNHAFVLHAEMSRAATLRELGFHAESLRLAEHMHQLHLQRFGERHQDTLAARRVLAMACVRTGDADRARRLLETALDGYRKIMGRDHPFAHACTTDLTVALRALGGHEPARAIDETTFQALTRLLGPDHYYSLCCSVGLVHDLFRLGRLEAAHSRSTETLARFGNQYGTDHVYTLACAHNHRIVCAALGLGEPVREPLAALARELGNEHPELRRAGEGELLECVIEPIPL